MTGWATARSPPAATTARAPRGASRWTRCRSAATSSPTGSAPRPASPYPPNYVPDSAPTATAWSTGKKTIDARLSQGPSSAVNVPGSNAGYKTYVRDRPGERGLKHRQRLHRGDHRRDPGRTLLALLPARLPRPDRHPRRLPDGEQGRRRPRLDRRAAGRRPGRRHPRRRPHALRAEPRRQAPPRPCSTTPSQGLQVRRYRGQLSAVQPRDGQQLLGLFHDRQHDDRVRAAVARKPAPARTPAVHQPQPANEPSLQGMTRKAIALLANNRTGSSSRSRARRSTSATTRLTPAARSASCSPSTTRSARRSTTRAAPRHARRRLGRSLPHEPDHLPDHGPRGLSATVKTADGTPIRSPRHRRRGGSQRTRARRCRCSPGPARGRPRPARSTRPTSSGPHERPRSRGRRRHDADRPGVGGTVAGTLALTLGAPAASPAFTPGVARDYTATASANVTSTGRRRGAQRRRPRARRLLGGPRTARSRWTQPLHVKATSAGRHRDGLLRRSRVSRRWARLGLRSPTTPSRSTSGSRSAPTKHCAPAATPRRSRSRSRRPTRREPRRPTGGAAARASPRPRHFAALRTATPA